MNGGNGKLFVIGGALAGILLLVAAACTASTNFLCCYRLWLSLRWRKDGDK